MPKLTYTTFIYIFMYLYYSLYSIYYIFVYMNRYKYISIERERDEYHDTYMCIYNTYEGHLVDMN